MNKKVIITMALVLISSFGFTVEKITEKMIKHIYDDTKLWEYATSELKENGYVFSVKNLLEENDKTNYPWATRVNGGVDESILVFFLQPDPDLNGKWQKGIGIVNGFAKSEALYKANNRAQDIEIKLYRFGVTPLQSVIEHPKGWMMWSGLKLLEQTNVILSDEYLSTNIIYFSADLGKDYKINNPDETIFCYALILTVKSVYKGSKYNDLCISEIRFLTDDSGVNTNSAVTN